MKTLFLTILLSPVLWAGKAENQINMESQQKDSAVHKTAPHAARFFEFVKGKIVNDKIEVVFLTALNNSK